MRASSRPGAKIAGSRCPRWTIDDRANADPAAIPLGRVSAAGGRAALDNFRHALGRARDGALDAIVFTPFNKQALRLGGMTFDDELRFAADFLGYTGPHGEFNVLDQLWNARVTSHLPLAEVAIAAQRAAHRRGDRAHRPFACAPPAMPRRASRSRRSIRTPAMAATTGARKSRSSRPRWTPRARRTSMRAGRTLPTRSGSARRDGQFDAVVTMYHDQGQIAIKLLGFERGVTLLGGLPIPITTPAHGTAYDIAGRGIGERPRPQTGVRHRRRHGSRSLQCRNWQIMSLAYCAGLNYDAPRSAQRKRTRVSHAARYAEPPAPNQSCDRRGREPMKVRTTLKLVAAGVALALAATSGSALAQKRVKWKMQSAFGGTLPHLGTSGVRFSKNSQGGDRRQVRHQVLRAGRAGAGAGMLRCRVQGLGRVLLDDAGLPHRQARTRRVVLHRGAVRPELRRIHGVEDVRRRRQDPQRDLRQARPDRVRLLRDRPRDLGLVQERGRSRSTS